MEQLFPESIIGTRVIYFDYLGCERYGKVVFFEPCSFDNTIVYLYIEDDEYDENNKSILINNIEIRYAEIRLSSDVALDSDK